MAGMIPQEFISDVVARTDIVDVMSEHSIELKTAGREEYKACCPFHGEKTPSFYVSREKQVYNCFGCKAKGNVITFLMEYDKLSFTDAVESLAERLGLDVPRITRSQRPGTPPPQESAPVSRDLYALMQECAAAFASVLAGPQGETAAAYLADRGITPATIQRFGMGFAPEQWDFLIRNVARGDQERLRQLSELGMIKQNESGRMYDMFRNRVMIPITDRRGRTVAFGGRVLNNDKPKYLNSPEMAIFHKGRELFGLNQAQEQSRLKKQPLQILVLVEGYMDVIALAQSGVDNAVASLGTSTTADQLQLIFHSARKLVCCYDGDEAGQRAAWHALVTMLPIITDRCDAAFAFLPPEHDPDSYVREHGREGFENYLKNALSLEDYFFSYLDSHNPGGTAELADEALSLLALMQNTFKLDSLLDTLAPRIFTSREKLGEKLQAKRNQLQRNARALPPIQESPQNALEITPVRRLLILAIQHPASIQSHGSEMMALLDKIRTQDPALKGLDVLTGLCDFILRQAQGRISAASIIQAYQGTGLEKWLHLLSEQELYSRAANVDPENVWKDIQSTISGLLVDYHQVAVAALREAGRNRRLTDEELQSITEHLRFIHAYFRRVPEGPAQAAPQPAGQGTPAPAQNPQQAWQNTQAPVQGTPAPAQNPQQAWQNTQVPVQGTPAPAQNPQQAWQNTQAPVQTPQPDQGTPTGQSPN